MVCASVGMVCASVGMVCTCCKGLGIARHAIIVLLMVLYFVNLAANTLKCHKLFFLFELVSDKINTQPKLIVI